MVVTGAGFSLPPVHARHRLPSEGEALPKNRKPARNDPLVGYSECKTCGIKQPVEVAVGSIDSEEVTVNAESESWILRVDPVGRCVWRDF